MNAILFLCENQKYLNSILSKLHKRGAYVIDVNEKIDGVFKELEVSMDRTFDIEDSSIKEVLKPLLTNLSITISAHENVVLGMSRNFEFKEVLLNNFDNIGLVLAFEHPYADIVENKNIIEEKEFKSIKEVKRNYFEDINDLYENWDNCILVDSYAIRSNFEKFKSQLNNKFLFSLKSNWETGDFKEFSLSEDKIADKYNYFLINQLLKYDSGLESLYRDTKKLSDIAFQYKESDTIELTLLDFINERKEVNIETLNKLRRMLKRTNQKLMKIKKQSTTPKKKIKI